MTFPLPRTRSFRPGPSPASVAHRGAAVGLGVLAIAATASSTARTTQRGTTSAPSPIPCTGPMLELPAGRPRRAWTLSTLHHRSLLWHSFHESLLDPNKCRFGFGLKVFSSHLDLDLTLPMFSLNICGIHRETQVQPQIFKYNCLLILSSIILIYSLIDGKINTLDFTFQITFECFMWSRWNCKSQVSTQLRRRTFQL